MKINQNNDILIYRGETAAIDFKMSQRSDYYVPFLVSSARVNPMICITIGSSRRESQNTVTKQLWLDLNDMNLPRFNQTVITDLGTIENTGMTTELLKFTLAGMMEVGVMYQFKLSTEVAVGNHQLHFAYEPTIDEVLIDDYDFTIIMAIDDSITLDLMNTDYFYQIELMDTEPMIPHIQGLFIQHPELLLKLPTGFTNTQLDITNHLEACITLITKTWPNYWGYRINDPYTSPVAKVSKIQLLQPPRRFTVQSVIK